MISLLQAIAEPTKHQILVELCHGPTRVSDLVKQTGHKQPNLSNHLAKLREAGLVHSHKRGREVFYSLSSKQVESAVLSFGASSSNEATHPDLSERGLEFAHLAVKGDESTCLALIDQLVAARVPSIDIYQGVITRAMHQVGEWYDAGSIEILHEHLASAIAERCLIRVHQSRTPLVRQQALALVGCAAGNFHTLGARMVCDVLAAKGWETKFLGANTPTESILAAARLHSPRIVLVSLCQVSPTAQEFAVFAALRELKTDLPQLVIGAGGQAVINFRTQIVEAGADFACADLEEFLAQPLLELLDHED